MNIKHGIGLVVFVWLGVGLCFGMAGLMAKLDRWIPPVVFMAIVATIAAFVLGSLLH